MAQLALLGGKKSVTAKSVSPHWPRFSAKAVAQVAKLLSDGKAITLGTSPLVMETEQMFAELFGVKYALAVGTGIASLHSALGGVDVGAGDEVITSPYSWGAATGCILQQGAIPIFADVIEETGLLDPARVEEKITPRTRAIVVVHIYGQPADMIALRKIARKHGLGLVEDCSQAHGARIKGKFVGSFGDAAGFSCMGGKLMGATEMGMLTTSSRDVYDRALLLSQHPVRLHQKPTPHGGGLSEGYRPYVDSLSQTYRTSDINCVLLKDQMPHLLRWNTNRAANRDRLANRVNAMGAAIRFPIYAPGIEPAYHMATMRYDADRAGGVSRETFARALSEEGAGCWTYVSSPISTWKRLQADGYTGPANSWIKGIQDAGIRYDASDIPVAMRLSEKLSLQMGFNGYTEIEEKLITQIGNAFEKVVENLPALLQWQEQQKQQSQRGRKSPPPIVSKRRKSA